MVSLYPESIAGRLSTPENDWNFLFGGPREETPTVVEPKPSEGTATGEEPQKAESVGQPISTPVSTVPAPGATTSFRGYLPNLMRPTAKDDDTASIASRRSVRRRVTMDIFETFGVSSATNNPGAPPVTSAPTPVPTKNVSTQLSPGRPRSSSFLPL